MTIGEDAREFTLEALEELSADSIGLGLEPRADTRPDAGERVRACPPITPRSGRAPMGGADLAVLPRRGQAGKKAIKLPSWRAVIVVLTMSRLVWPSKSRWTWNGLRRKLSRSFRA